MDGMSNWKAREMVFNSQDYAPYFRDGLLFLPEKTLALLVEAGLDVEVAYVAQRGLALDDDRALIGEISATLERVMGQIAEGSQAYQELNTHETYFLLTGRPAS
jgi:hypothetical protein